MFSPHIKRKHILKAQGSTIYFPHVCMVFDISGPNALSVTYEVVYSYVTY